MFEATGGYDRPLAAALAAGGWRMPGSIRRRRASSRAPPGSRPRPTGSTPACWPRWGAARAAPAVPVPSSVTIASIGDGERWGGVVGRRWKREPTRGPSAGAASRRACGRSSRRRTERGNPRRRSRQERTSSIGSTGRRGRAGMSQPPGACGRPRLPAPERQRAALPTTTGSAARTAARRSAAGPTPVDDHRGTARPKRAIGGGRLLPGRSTSALARAAPRPPLDGQGQRSPVKQARSALRHAFTSSGNAHPGSSSGRPSAPPRCCASSQAAEQQGHGPGLDSPRSSASGPCRRAPRATPRGSGPGRPATASPAPHEPSAAARGSGPTSLSQRSSCLLLAQAAGPRAARLGRAGRHLARPA